MFIYLFFFFSSRRRHTRYWRDWSSDVCSSDLAPLEASSGKSQRHRLDRGGNRQLNAALYRIAITQARYHPPARDYLERSEERRVGKECRSRWSPKHEKKKERKKKIEKNKGVKN